MKITIACPGRFHVGDLARELHQLENEVVFHSMVPRSRLAPVGLPNEIQRCHLSAVWPWAILQRYGRLNAAAAERNNGRIVRGLDARYAKIKEPGDVFIGMSGLCVESLKAAKLRGARVILERGSSHILSQREILDGLPSKCGSASSVPDWIVERELEGYDLADVISIPSIHVERSFLENGVSREKLFRNPYGVNLSAFSPMERSMRDFDVIMTGAWSYRKGCDVLAEAVLERLSLKLLHVGPIGDCPLPESDGFLHVDSVPQAELPRYYARAGVFAMPSEEEGLSMVQAQALSCGLPIIGSTRSGSVDLAEMMATGIPVTQSVIPGDVDGLVEAITRALTWVGEKKVGADLLGPRRDQLGWAAYGRRYHDFLHGAGEGPQADW